MGRKEKKEQLLLKQIIRGDRVAMKEFYDTFSGYLTTVCSRYLSNKEDVKDVLQESFIKIFNAMDKFQYKGEGSLRAWSTRIVVNEALKQDRKSTRLNSSHVRISYAVFCLKKKTSHVLPCGWRSPTWHLCPERCCPMPSSSPPQLCRTRGMTTVKFLFYCPPSWSYGLTCLL